MQETILSTGYTEAEFKKLGLDENLKCCYRCHITEEDRAAVITKEGMLFPKTRLFPLCVKIRDSNLLVKFLLCVECYLLLRAERNEDAQSLPMEIFEREGMV